MSEPSPEPFSKTRIPAVGDRVEAYELGEIIGRGGMGVVFRAKHSALGSDAAIKFLHPLYCSDEKSVRRFFREARAAAKLASPYVARVHHVGIWNGELPFMVMEFLRGQDLGSALANGLTWGSLVDAIRGAALGLEEAHAAGIIHRDMKPGNIFLVEGSGERPKIVDFGIAHDADATQLTTTSSVLGTIYYMAPEQVSGEGVDARSDIWALGVVLYLGLTGELPFTGATPPEKIGAILYGEAVPLTVRDSRIPPELSAVVARCLRKKPAERFQSARELYDALSPFASDGRLTHVRAQPSIAEPGFTAPIATANPSSVPRAVRSPGRPLHIGSAVVTFVVVVGVFLGWLFAQGR